MKTAIFYLITIGFMIALIVAGDILIGQFNNIDEIRNTARQFREEAAFLRFPTKNMVPGLNHVYVDSDVPKDAESQGSKRPRKLRTDRNGIVVGEAAPALNAKKIIFLGGSTTECNEVPEPFRFPAMVESLLRGSGLNIATLNAGVRGHTTQDSINSLLNRPGFRDADVDVIVLMHNINDRLRLGVRGNYDASLGTDGPTSGRAVVNSAQALMTSVWDYISYRSNSLFLIRYWSDENAAWLDKPQNPAITKNSINLFEEAALKNRPKFEENLRIFVLLVRAMGKRPVLMTQGLGQYSAVQEKFNDSIRSVASREHVLLVDLDMELGRDRSWAFFSDEIHLNTSGSIFVGRRIAAAIAPMFGTP